jgi:hypothetical protein
MAATTFQRAWRFGTCVRSNMIRPLVKSLHRRESLALQHKPGRYSGRARGYDLVLRAEQTPLDNLLCRAKRRWRKWFP